MSARPHYTAEQVRKSLEAARRQLERTMQVLFVRDGTGLTGDLSPVAIALHKAWLVVVNELDEQSEEGE